MLFKKIILFAPFALISLITVILPIDVRFWVKPLFLLVFLLAGLFQKSLYLEAGNLPTRKRLELAFCAVLFFLSLTKISSIFYFWPVLPLFLFFVWSGFSFGHLIALAGVSLFFFKFWLHGVPGIQQHLMFVVVVSSALLFRSLERKKKNQLQKKLDSFETFEKRISTGEIDLNSLTHLEAKKNSKIGELILQEEERFEQFVDLIHSIFEPHSVLIYTFDPLHEEFNLQAYKSRSINLEVHRRLPPEGILKAVETQKKSILFQSKNEITHLPYYKKTPRLVSVIATPIYHQSLLVGLVIVDQDRREFVKGHVQVLEKIAASISQFIQDAETIYSYFKLKEELTSFYSASSMLNQAFHLQNVYDVFLKTSHEIIPFDLAFLIMWDPGSKCNRIVAQYGEFESWIGETFALSPSKGLVSWVVENRKPLFYDGYRQRYEHSPLFHKKLKLPNVFQSVCIFPLEVKEEMLGSVLFLGEKNQAFSQSVRKILEVLSMQASIAIKNAKMVRDLEQLATTDGLTGLLNHRTFQKQLIHELERAKRTRTPLSLMLVDLDHFKKINDNYGHPMGDFVLKETAAFLKQSVRTVDFVARYGGEEFAIILPDTSPEDAHQMAQRMSVEIKKKEMMDQGIPLSVTFSIGISSYPDHTTLKEQLIDFADTALYHSKKTGRSRATLFTKNLKTVDFTEKEHILIHKAEKILREQ